MTENVARVKCPHCGGEILPTARRCWMCRSILGDEASGGPTRVGSAIESIALTALKAVGILVLVGFALFAALFITCLYGLQNSGIENINH